LSVADERSSVVAEAREWRGTPFHHGVGVKGVGVDCAQLLIAVYVGLGIVEGFDPGYYAPDWFLHDYSDRFVDWLRARCVERSQTVPLSPGDILLYRYGRVASHGAIYIGGDRVIHAFRTRGVVEEECGQGSALAARFVGAWTPMRWIETQEAACPA
jgi:NlpC/P60 family putative phage cell wall peptidase